MTPGQARVALLAFLVVTTGVAINALFLQSTSAPAAKAASERKPARAPAERARKASEAIPGGRAGLPSPGSVSSEHTLRIARFAPDPTRLDKPPPAATEVPSTKAVAAIQRELDARGYGPLSGDGVIDLATRAAIIAFEYDHGLAPTGEPSEPLLQRILFGAPPGGDPAAATRPPSPQAEDTVRAVQRWLAALGYPVGRIDGRLGEDTVKSIRDFEMDKGLVPKGRISAELVARLREATAGPSRR
jgi:peptidoglycan hydrolase-like protein with peptidoglycan-binding domain